MNEPIKLMASGTITQNLESDIHIKTITLISGENAADITTALNRSCVPVPKGFTIVFVTGSGFLFGVCFMHCNNRYNDGSYGMCSFLSYYIDGSAYYQCVNGVWSKKS